MVNLVAMEMRRGGANDKENTMTLGHADDGGTTMTRRTWVLACCALLAAMPLVWFSVDTNAGDTLLKLTSPSAKGSTSAPTGLAPAK
jgi:hypothetical protein